MMHSRNGKIYQEVDLETLSMKELINILKGFLQAEAIEDNCGCDLCEEDRADDGVAFKVVDGLLEKLMNNNK